jgi:RND family efflux transporter MFP subunit
MISGPASNMSVSVKKLILFALVLALAGGSVYALRSEKQQTAAKPASPGVAVKSAIAEKRDVPMVARTNGNVVPFNIVEIRPQTQNVVREVHVREGQDVKAGQLLFTLDTRVDNANALRAQAQVEKDRADLTEAESSLKRNEELLARKFVAQAAVDTARARVDALRGTLKADIAAAQGSSATLSYNKIVASMSGRIGLINVHAGSLAQPSGLPMLTIAQVEPIAVAFSLPESQLQHIRASYPNGEAPVKVELAGGTVQGKLYFIDNTADTQTGTIKMKARFDNADRRLWPGTYVNVSLVTRTLKDVVVVPPQAVITGPNDKLVYAIQSDNTVKAHKVKVLSIDEGQAAVEGLAPGTRVVVEGAQNLRPNAKVREAQAPRDSAAASAAATRL